MGSKPKAIKPPKVNYEKDLGDFVTGLSSVLPQILDQEGKFRPQFQGLNLGDIQSFLSGVDGQQGIFGLSREASQQAGMGLGEAREAELGQMTGQAGLTRGLMDALSPEQQVAVSNAAQEAERARAAAQGVSPQERRLYEQQAREGFQSAGRLGGNLGIVSEAMGREDVLARKRAEASQAGQNVYNMAQGFYTQPGLSLLSSAPMSYQAGQNQLGLGLGAIGAGTPQLFDTSAGLNLGAANRQNQLNAEAATQQNRAAYSSGLMSLGGSIGGAAITAI